MKNYALWMALSGCILMTAACGDTRLNPAGIGPSSTIDTPTVLHSVANTTLSRLGESVGANVNSCPDGSAPDHFVVNLNDGRADFSWDGIVNVDRYDVTMERDDVTNTFVPGGSFVETGTQHSLLMDTEGRYRAQIRTHSCQTHTGPWSEWLYFSTELRDGGLVEDPPPVD